MKFRIGLGYDVHQLEKGRDFWLGGIKIPHTSGAIGHSDADVLIHAICDSLLGAANLKDIGYHFSNKDLKYKGIDSKILLTETVKMIRNEGYEIGNIDSTILLQEPKIAPFIDEMRKVLSGVMEIPESDVSIKATTTETMGFVGREEGVSAYASALIYKP
ncbi:MAG TPA: 2-C-methyl-D-erythritol 2,4-cyclodiphosphate synthase [Cytophagales bacterium]|nr:2-C-methyl-D-erythritol 2,4-cyclodiphosphate synthase [Cytophagales bacterium]